ncbi:MAG: hypothetical protein FK730_04710 [Asgard group archaeon]|nr:hypothetical protein [Asgard group archaeon]
MVIIKLDDLGDVEIGKRLKANINITAKQFFEKFPEASAKLSRDAKQQIIYAINKNEEPKLRKFEAEIKRFFEEVRTEMSMGFDVEEEEEFEEAEELKGEEMDEPIVQEEPVLETFDEDTGESEGIISVKEDRKDDTKLVPIIIEEQFEIFYEHDGTPAIKDRIKKGLIKLENISDKDRLWDINLKLANRSNTNLDEESISIKELDPNDSFEKEYQIDVDVTPELEVKEFISTVNNPEEQSFSLGINTDNEVYMKIQLVNTANDELTNVELSKELSEIIENAKVSFTSHGKAEVKKEYDTNTIFWNIESLGANAEANLELRVTINIDDKNTKVRSGNISVSYETKQAISELSIDKFDAYTNNAFSIVTEELEEEPNTYECKFIFENKSDYVIRLVNADVYKPKELEAKFVDIDPYDIPEIPAGGIWESNAWNYSTKEGKYPKFKTKVEFYTVADHRISTKYKLNYSDVELAVAALEGHLNYDIEEIPSFKITTFNLTGKVTNSGGADLNEVILVENIQEAFLPPKPHEVTILVNGQDIMIPDGAITIEPDDVDATKEHTLSIKLDNLKDSDIGVVKPGDDITIKYPIVAHKPSKDSLYKSDAKLSANTYPPGNPIVLEVDPIEINVVHVRHSISKSKDVQALDIEGEFLISLTIKNMGESEIENYEITEKISSDLILWDVTHDPEVVDKTDQKTLSWNIEAIDAGETIEISYKIKPAGESKVSETQESE